jgi:hypothetical protein
MPKKRSPRKEGAPSRTEEEEEEEEESVHEDFTQATIVRRSASKKTALAS